MTIWEIILVSIGLSLDVYAVVVLYSAMLAKIEKRKLVNMCLIFAGWQMLAVLAGNLITELPFFKMVSTQMEHLWDVISVVIFFAWVHTCYTKRESVRSSLSIVRRLTTKRCVWRR